MKTMVERQILLETMFCGTICQRHIETIFLYHSAAVLNHAKPAALITIKEALRPLWKQREKAMSKASGLQILELYNKKESSLFLIYDERELETAISNEHTTRILREFGYRTDGCLEEVLEQLISRFSLGSFPHEIGLFLGYPPSDVVAYIENNGKNATCCRYWKAYGDAKAAQKIWLKIDESKMQALHVLQNLPPIHIAANQLRAV